MRRRAFDVIGAAAVDALLSAPDAPILPLIREAYLALDAGRAVNPPSLFLRFADKPSARIIALPARLQGAGDPAASCDVAGLKWIASFPDNHAAGLPRASAVVVLNDMATGFPIACLEGSAISAARTAASAALAAEILHGTRAARRLAVIGAGPIAAGTVACLRRNGWRIDEALVHDLVTARAGRFAGRLAAEGLPAAVAPSAAAAIESADLVLFATTAGTPYLDDPALFNPAQTVLHVSLRDLAPAVILAGQNIVDDVEHCLKAATSVHLTEQSTGSRAFLAGTLADLINGRIAPDRSRPRLFSPFGLGVLDLALAHYVHAAARAAGTAVTIDNFLPEA